MAPHARNPPMIVVTSEVNSPDNTAHIGRFGARSRPDSSLEPEISDVHQVEGPFQSYSSDAPFHFSSSDDNSFNGTAFQASSQRSFPLYSSPESNFSDTSLRVLHSIMSPVPSFFLRVTPMISRLPRRDPLSMTVLSK